MGGQEGGRKKIKNTKLIKFRIGNFLKGKGNGKA